MTVISPQRTQLRYSEELITVAKAMAYMALNRDNYRRLNVKHASVLAQELTEGRWVMTGEAIIFGVDEEGNEILLDGQHRLYAVILSGVPAVMTVTRGVPPEAVDVMGSGKPRNSADVVRRMGLGNANTIAAGASLVLKYQASAFTNGNYSSTYFQRGDVVGEEVQKRFALYSEWGTRSSRCKHLNITGSSIVAFGVLTSTASTVNLEVRDRFMDGVETGAGLSSGNPALTYREWALRNRTSMDKKITGPEHLAALIRTFNAYEEGKSLKAIKVWRPGGDFKYPTLNEKGLPT